MSVNKWFDAICF